MNNDILEYQYPVDILDSQWNPTITVRLKDEFKTSSKCRSCGATIYRALTTKGKKIPISKKIEGNGDTYWIAHFTDCPGATNFRK